MRWGMRPQPRTSGRQSPTSATRPRHTGAAGSNQRAGVWSSRPTVSPSTRRDRTREERRKGWWCGSRSTTTNHCRLCGIGTTFNGFAASSPSQSQDRTLTTTPNAVAAPVHPKAIPVFLTTDGERDVWMWTPRDEEFLQQAGSRFRCKAGDGKFGSVCARRHDKFDLGHRLLFDRLNPDFGHAAQLPSALFDRVVVPTMGPMQVQRRSKLGRNAQVAATSGDLRFRFLDFGFARALRLDPNLVVIKLKLAAQLVQGARCASQTLRVSMVSSIIEVCEGRRRR